MYLTNTESVPGQTITKQLGIVSGSSVRSRNALKDFGAAWRNFFGGELKTYTRLLNEARDEALERMTKQAQSLGANAVTNVRFSTSSIAAGAAEIYVYGTAAILSDQ